MLKENIKTEVESSEVDLSSFKKQNTLPPKIWKDEGTLDSKVRLKLLDIADDFWEFVNLTWVEPKGIIMTGSLCNYNWSEFSDVDLHLIVDFDEIDEKTEFVKQYLDSKKNEWNNEHEKLKIMGYPVELYVQDTKDDVEASGIYDLEENKWVRHPNPDNIKSIGLDKFGIKDKAAEIMTIIDDMYDAFKSTDDSHKIEEIGEDAKYLCDKVKDMRKNGLGEKGESSPGNVCYKILRRTGYLDKLWKLRTLCYDKTNSITESKEKLNEYLDRSYGAPLYRYFKWANNASDREKAEDLIYHCSSIFKKYLEDENVYGYYDDLDELIDEYYNDSDLVYDEDFVDRVLDVLEKNKLIEKFIDNAPYYVDSQLLPTWVTMDLVRVVKNEWCIHFTSDADNIAREGFTGGTPDIEDLAYTGAGMEKHYAGYDFAYLLDDRNVDCAKYGDEAVIFRASGVLATHYGDTEDQVIFWGPSVKEIIPIKKDEYSYNWNIEGLNGQILKSGKPSELANWAVKNLPQYRKQILVGKSGHSSWGFSRPQFESVKKYITLLKDNMINEEFNADGNTEHNPYKKRWEAEREALKNYISNYGVVMQSKEDNKNGKLYKCLYDKWISQLIGYNYCLCVQWDNVKLKPKSVVYIRAWDKFTPNIKQVTFDNRGFDNQRGTYDDLTYSNV